MNTRNQPKTDLPSHAVRKDFDLVLGTGCEIGMGRLTAGKECLVLRLTNCQCDKHADTMRGSETD